MFYSDVLSVLLSVYTTCHVMHGPVLILAWHLVSFSIMGATLAAARQAGIAWCVDVVVQQETVAEGRQHGG